MQYKITFSFFVTILLISLYSLFTIAFADDSVQHTNFPTSITSKAGDKSQTFQYNNVYFTNVVSGTTCDNATILSYAVTNVSQDHRTCYQGYFVKVNKGDGVSIKNISAAQGGLGLIERDNYYIFSLEGLGHPDCILNGSNVISETDAMYIIDAKGQTLNQHQAFTLALQKLEKISNGLSDDDVQSNIQTITCPTDADVNLYNFLSNNDVKKYKDLKPCIDAEYVFYPQEVAGKTFSVNQTFNFKEKVQERWDSLSDYFSHAAYFSKNRDRTIYYSYTKDYTFDIPSDYQSLPSRYTDLNDSSITYPVYYDSATNKIYVRVSVLREDIDDDYHKYLKDFKNWSDDDPNKKQFKYGHPVCNDCEFDTKNYAGKYKHIGDPCRSDKHHTLDATCQLITDSASSDYFHFFANLDPDQHLKIATDGTYVDDKGDKHTKDPNASIRFLDSEPQGGTNGYIDSHYTDSDKDIIYNTKDDFNLDSDNKVKDPSFTDSVNTLKNLLKSLKDFPQFFADFFDFLPGSYALATLLMILITIMIVVGFVKLVL